MTAMTTHIALIRGINVGRNKRIAMADLRAMLASLGYRDVRTLLQSGNAVFTAPGSTAAVATAAAEPGAVNTALPLWSSVRTSP